MALPDPDNPLAIEIQQEAAAAYFGACKKMIEALDALKGFDATETTEPNRRTGGASRVELLDAAAERVYFVVIQREAMKLSCAEDFFADYEISREIRKRMGARRRNLSQ